MGNAERVNCVVSIETCFRHVTIDVTEIDIASLLGHVFRDEGFTDGDVSVAVVDDPEMHELNRRHLDHDYPTDVLSFVFERNPPSIVGEIVVSAETAKRESRQYGWSPQNELVLYLVHGALHLIGYDDKSPADRQEMRQREAYWLEQLGLPTPPSEHSITDGQGASPS